LPILRVPSCLGLSITIQFGVCASISSELLTENSEINYIQNQFLSVPFR
jgi:hypothetical protein